MELHSIQHQDQKFTYTDHKMVLPASVTDALSQILNKWQQIFPHENTLIQTAHNVPSLFVRFDCVISEDGELQFYEIQDGPAWVGYAGVANEAFRKIRDEIVGSEWPNLKLMRSNLQKDTDDELWIPRVKSEVALKNQYPLLVRNRLKMLESDQRDAIIKRSVRPVLKHNDKQYGVDLGWWKPVSWQETSHGENLPWTDDFVLKPQSGHGSQDVMIWISGNRAGRATRTQIKRALEEYGTMYLQPFIAPMRTEIDGAMYNFIYRPYFIYSIKRKKYIPMHGLWAARPYPNLRIHGASDAINGPLLMQ